MKLDLVAPEKRFILKPGEGYVTNLTTDGITKRVLWMCCTVCEQTILASDHTITEHSDGTITIEPSLVCPTEGCTAHFFIKRNVIE